MPLADLTLVTANCNIAQALRTFTDGAQTADPIGPLLVYRERTALSLTVKNGAGAAALSAAVAYQLLGKTGAAAGLLTGDALYTATTQVWATATAYAQWDVIWHGAAGYLCLAAHTSGTDDDEPGVGANTATYWEVVTTYHNPAGGKLLFVVNANTAELATELGTGLPGRLPHASGMRGKASRAEIVSKHATAGTERQTLAQGTIGIGIDVISGLEGDPIYAMGYRHNWSATAAPTATDDADDGYVAGKSVWIYGTLRWRCTDDTAGAAVWEIEPTLGQGELTIASGVIAPTRPIHTLDTESDAASDDLDTITHLAGLDLLVVARAHSGRAVVFKHGTGNIATPDGADYTLPASAPVVLMYVGSEWFLLPNLLAALAGYLPLAGGTMAGDIDLNAVARLLNVPGLTLQAASELTIASGVVTSTGPIHSLDTESDAATDQLDEIQGGTGLLLLYLENAARVVTIAHGTSANDIITADGNSLVMTAYGLVVLYRLTTAEAWRVVAGGSPIPAAADIPVAASPSNYTEDSADVEGHLSGIDTELGTNAAAIAALDAAKIAIPGSSARGDVLYRDASGWTRLAAGTSGHFLKTLGAGADPAWAAAEAAAIASTGIQFTAVGKYVISVDQGSPDAQTVLLLHLDNAVTDVSQSAHSPTNNGGTFDGSVKKFGDYAYKLQVGDYLSIPDSADFAFGSGDFTIDFWWRSANVTSAATIYLQDDGAGNRVRIGVASGTPGSFTAQVDVSSSTVVDLTGATTLSVDTWYHVALERYGNTFTLFVDGVADDTDSYAGSLPDVAHALEWGDSAGSQAFDRYLDEARVSKGIARYEGAGFTPETAAYANEFAAEEADIPAAPTLNLPEFSYAALDQYNGALYAYWGLHETSGDRYDSARKIALLDTNTVTSATGKNGNAAQFTRANGEYLEGTAPPVTIAKYYFDCWIYVDSTGITQGIAGAQTGATYPWIWFYVTNTNKMEADCGYASGASLASVTGTTTISASTWYHVAIYVDVADKVYLLVNGVSEGTPVSLSGALATGNRIYLGTYYDGGVSSNTFDGRLCEAGLWINPRFPSITEATAFAAARYNSGSGRYYE